MYLVVAGGNVIVVLWPDAGRVHLALHVAMASLVTYWCVVDSRMRRSPIVTSLHWVIFFTWPIAVLIYLIWSRRFRGVGLALAHGIGLFAVALGAYHVIGYLSYGSQWLDEVLGL